jgi:hypothetical protein
MKGSNSSQNTGQPGYGLDDRGTWVRLPARSLISTKSRLAVIPTSGSYTMGIGANPPELKRRGREANDSTLSSAEVRNGGAIPPLSTCLHGDVNLLSTKY